MAKRTVRITPGSLTVVQARIGMVVALLMLIFGVGFFATVAGETSASEPELALLQKGFFIIWIVVCLGILYSFSRVAMRGSCRVDSLAEVEVEDQAAGPEESGGTAPGDFAERLRRLEGLRADKLVSEEEYQAKRREILAEKW